MVLDVPNIESDDEEDESICKSEDEDGPIVSRRRPKGLGRLHISRLLQMVLQDAQTRLFFKAQSTIQAEIRYYVPKSEDLAYPEKLVGVLVTTMHSRAFKFQHVSAFQQRLNTHHPPGDSDTRKRRTSARSSRSSRWINKRRGTRLYKKLCGYYRSSTTLSRFAYPYPSRCFG